MMPSIGASFWGEDVQSDTEDTEEEEEEGWRRRVSSLLAGAGAVRPIALFSGLLYLSDGVAIALVFP